MIRLKVEKKIKGKWWTKRDFLESCEMENLTWRKDKGNCHRFVCPLCEKGSIDPEGRHIHPLDIWEHLDHHPEIEVRINWRIKDKNEADIFNKKQEEEITLDFVENEEYEM